MFTIRNLHLKKKEIYIDRKGLIYSDTPLKRSEKSKMSFKKISKQNT